MDGGFVMNNRFIMRGTQAQTKLTHDSDTPIFGSIYAFPGAKLTEPHPTKTPQTINNKNSVVIFLIIIQNPVEY